MSRASKRKIIAERIKTVKQLENELKEIRKAQSRLGYMVLDKPIRDGWYKSYRLRDDILRSKKSKVYQEVLNAVLIVIRGREKKHADKKWDKFFNKQRRNIQRPGIRRLYEKEFSKLSSNAQRCFLRRKRKTYKGYKNFYVCILPRYYFQLTYKRAYITKQKIISPILESREKEIMEILSRPTLRTYSVYYKYHCRLYHNPNKSERRKIKMALSNKLEFVLIDTLNIKECKTCEH